MARLNGKVAIVTGAAGAQVGGGEAGSSGGGMGQAIATLFAQEGAKVVLADVVEKAGQTLAAQLKERGADTAFSHLDVTNEDMWRDTVSVALNTFGRVDVLVNVVGGAGSGVAMAPIDELSLEGWRRELDFNLTGAFLGLRAVIKPMREGGGGSVVNIASIYGIMGGFYNPAYPEVGLITAGYNAGKGGLRALTRNAAVRHGADKIRVNCICPGFNSRNTRQPDEIAGQISVTPLGRVGTPMDIAYGALYLASDESSFVTGTDLIIDGGWLAH